MSARSAQLRVGLLVLGATLVLIVALFLIGRENRIFASKNRYTFTAGSVAGAADARLLRGYRARGLRVVGMRTQVLALRVVGSGPDRLRVRVSDRLAGAVAVRGTWRQSLPRDAVSSRVVALERASKGRWHENRPPPY